MQVFSQQLSPYVSNIYTHLTVIVALKVNEGSNASKGIEKEQVTLTFTNKLEVWKILLIVQHHLGPSGARMKSSVYYFMDSLHNHLFIFLILSTIGTKVLRNWGVKPTKLFHSTFYKIHMRVVQLQYAKGFNKDAVTWHFSSNIREEVIKFCCEM